jgi:hypothetical protein
MFLIFPLNLISSILPFLGEPAIKKKFLVKKTKKDNFFKKILVKKLKKKMLKK